MSELQIHNVVQQMRTVLQTHGLAGTAAPAATPAAVEQMPTFGQLLREALRAVNGLQQEAADLQTRFELGDERVSLPQVTIAMSKASIAFDALSQTRNRLLSAYQEIMRMPV